MYLDDVLYVSADGMFNNFTTHTCEGDWPIICRQITVSFVVVGVTIASFHTNGNSPVFRDLLKIAVRAGVSSLSSSLSILHGISSGHCAFFGLIPLRSFVTPVGVTSNIEIVG